MKQKLIKLLGKIDADFADIRYEIKTETLISFEGFINPKELEISSCNELTNIGSNSTDGFVLRVLKGNGLASIAFTNESDFEKALKIVIQNAKIIDKHFDKKINLAPAPVINDTYIPKLCEDPRTVSLEEKIDLISKYNCICMNNKKIESTELNYGEIIREKYYANSEGTNIREDLITTRLLGEIYSKDGNFIQNLRIEAGGSNGFSTIRNLEKYFEKRIKIVIDLLKAEQIDSGKYNCIINPLLVGAFTHEAFGHMSEADMIENSPLFREKMKLGTKFGMESLNIIDDSTIQGELGHYKYDDEGVEVKKVYLMKNGILSGRLHSRESAYQFAEPTTGHFTAADYRFSPIIRMGTIYIEPQKKSFDYLLNSLGDGLYVLDCKGGNTSGENYTFGAQYGYYIKNGKIGKMVRDMNISGDLYSTLNNIVLIGSDLKFNKGGACGKGQGGNIKSCLGGPHIIVNNLLIGA